MHWKPDPIYLDNLYGKGGRKWVAGGLLVRECKNWWVNGERVTDQDLSYRAGRHEYEGYNLLQMMDPGFDTPLCAMIDHFGQRFLVYTLAPVSQSTLRYGSNTERLFIERDPNVDPIALNIATKLNLKPHNVEYQLSSAMEKPSKQLTLPYDLEIHRLKNGLNFVMSPMRLMPPDVFDLEYIGETTFKFHRPELVRTYTDGQI